MEAGDTFAAFDVDVVGRLLFSTSVMPQGMPGSPTVLQWCSHQQHRGCVTPTAQRHARVATKSKKQSAQVRLLQNLPRLAADSPSTEKASPRRPLTDYVCLPARLLRTGRALLAPPASAPRQAAVLAQLASTPLLTSGPSYIKLPLASGGLNLVSKPFASDCGAAAGAAGCAACPNALLPNPSSAAGRAAEGPPAAPPMGPAGAACPEAAEGAREDLSGGELLAAGRKSPVSSANGSCSAPSLRYALRAHTPRHLACFAAYAVFTPILMTPLEPSAPRDINEHPPLNNGGQAELHGQ